MIEEIIRNENQEHRQNLERVLLFVGKGDMDDEQRKEVQDDAGFEIDGARFLHRARILKNVRKARDKTRPEREKRRKKQNRLQTKTGTAMSNDSISIAVCTEMAITPREYVQVMHMLRRMSFVLPT